MKFSKQLSKLIQNISLTEFLLLRFIINIYSIHNIRKLRKKSIYQESMLLGHINRNMEKVIHCHPCTLPYLLNLSILLFEKPPWACFVFLFKSIFLFWKNNESTQQFIQSGLLEGLLIGELDSKGKFRHLSQNIYIKHMQLNLKN